MRLTVGAISLKGLYIHLYIHWLKNLHLSEFFMYRYHIVCTSSTAADAVNGKIQFPTRIRIFGPETRLPVSQKDGYFSNERLSEFIHACMGTPDTV